MEDNTISFGKYKGQPVEILANDKQYSDWLLAQSWFKEKYINLYQVVINNFREPSETPEHNTMQVKFLDLNHRLKFAYAIDKKVFACNNARINEAIKNVNPISKKHSLIKHLSNDERFKDYDLIKTRQLILEDGFDVSFRVSCGLTTSYNDGVYNQNFDYELEFVYFIEIKPTISDDFPAVLRQMKNSMRVRDSFVDGYKRVLLIKEYTGVGAKEEDFINYFESQGIYVVFEKQIENTILSDIDFKFTLDESVND